MSNYLQCSCIFSNKVFEDTDNEPLFSRLDPCSFWHSQNYNNLYEINNNNNDNLSFYDTEVGTGTANTTTTS